MSNKPTSYQSGIEGEALARAYLIARGYRILVNRFKTPVGEIDLVAKRPLLGSVCFIEVKAHADLTKAAEAISQRQKQRVSHAAMVWLQDNPAYQNSDCRFDALLIQRPSHKDPQKRLKIMPKIQHLRNAWSLDEIGL